jgi:hypothetical protein
MAPAKSGGREVGAGEALAEITEKKQLPFWDFSSEAKLEFGRAKRRGQEKKVLKTAFRRIRGCRPVIASMETGSQNGNPGINQILLNAGCRPWF